jgi:cell division septation protein DedD
MTDIYQSPGDRLRFEILLKSLTEGSINLAVLSDHDRVLDDYGSLFEERLRAKGESHIEWCSSTNSEKLVQKFNEILSEITLDQALEKDKKHAPRRFLLFRDSILMQDFELQLLARLVNGFPAGNISVILLINSAGNYHSKLEAFGKNLLKWEVETEAGEAKQKLTDWVATTPDPEPTLIEPSFLPEPPTLSDEVTPVSKLLNLPTKTAWRVPGFGKKQEPQLDVEPLPAFVPPPLSSVAPALAPSVPPVTASAAALAPDASREPTLSSPTPLAGATAASADVDLFKRPARKSYAGWVLLVLLLSMATFGFMYKDLVLEEAELLKKYLLRGTPAVAAPDEAASAAAAAAAASAEALAAAELAASVASDAARVASQADQVASAASAMAVSAVPAAVVASEPVAVASAEPKAKKPADKVEAKAEAKPEANSDEAWVNQLPTNGYVVQLAAMDTQEDMRSFQRSNAVYAKARIMRARHKDSGKRYFILVAGPFETKTQADTFMQSSPLLAKGWLRSTKSMKTQFTKS